jgi:hypothetical protein
MPNLFLLNQTLYGDKPGLGAYEVGHFLQHQQYLNILAGSGVTMPDYNILRMGSDDPHRFFGENDNEFLSWLNDHYAMHLFLRQQANGAGTGDLSYFDTQSPEAWAIWQQDHAADHAVFDQHFGTT